MKMQMEMQMGMEPEPSSEWVGVGVGVGEHTGVGLGTWDLGTGGVLGDLVAAERNLGTSTRPGSTRLFRLPAPALAASLAHLLSPGPRFGSRARASDQGHTAATSNVLSCTIEIPGDPADGTATCQVPPQITSRK